jgi:YhcH/YjgK/YiaL family protein
MEVKGIYAVDRLEHIGRYAGISAAFAKAAEFLRRTDLGSLAAGRYDIDGDDCFVIVNDKAELVPPSERKPEFHRRYFDIQIPLTGDETYGLAELDVSAVGEFDVLKDIGFVDQKTVPVTLGPGEFAIFFPEKCAHAPACSLSGPRTIRKMVVKVRDGR